MTTKPITTLEIKQVRRRLEEGMTYVQIAHERNCTLERLYQLKFRFLSGVEIVNRQHRKLSDQQQMMVRQMHRSGKSQRWLAEHFQVSQSCIRDCLKKQEKR